MKGVNIDSRPTKGDVFPALVESRGDRPVLIPLDPQAWLSALGKLLGEGVVVTIERPKLAGPTDPQRGYLWGVVYVDILSGLRELAVSVGEECPFKTKDDLHDAFKYMWLGVEVVRVPGVGDMERPSTSTILTPAQYSEFTEKCIRWAGERGIPVRQPGEEIVA